MGSGCTPICQMILFLSGCHLHSPHIIHKKYKKHVWRLWIRTYGFMHVKACNEVNNDKQGYDVCPLKLGQLSGHVRCGGQVCCHAMHLHELGALKDNLTILSWVKFSFQYGDVKGPHLHNYKNTFPHTLAMTPDRQWRL